MEYQECIERLADLALLEENWDSYGSRRITSTALLNAGKLIFFIFDDCEKLPHWIGPINGGGIQVEYRSSKTELEIVIDCEKATKNFDYWIKDIASDHRTEADNVSIGIVIELVKEFC